MIDAMIVDQSLPAAFVTLEIIILEVPIGKNN